MELINCNYPLHYWNYDINFHLQDTDCPDALFSGDFFDFVGFKKLIHSYLAGNKTYPLILEAESNILWIAGFLSDKNMADNIYLIGPILSGRDTQVIFRKKLDSYDLSVRTRAAMHKIFEKIPIVPFNIIKQYAVMLHYCLNQEKIAAYDVILQNAHSSDPKETISSNSNSHAGVWMNEQLLCKMLSDGDPRYKEVLQKSNMLSCGLKTDIGDALRSHKNNAMVLLVLCSRACIQGGLSPDISYDLNDYYAQKIECCKSITDVSYICSEMLEDYVSRVREVKMNTSVSNIIRNSYEYIKSHLTESISIEELAKRSGYTGYYFSHKFKKEMGCTVNDFIIKEKIECAKLLLSGTSESIQSISDKLAFSNRSYFYTCFQKITGTSPTEYRKVHHMEK